MRLKLLELTLARALLRKHGFQVTGVDRELELLRQATRADEPASEQEDRLMKLIWGEFVREKAWMDRSMGRVA